MRRIGGKALLAFQRQRQPVQERCSGTKRHPCISVGTPDGSTASSSDGLRIAICPASTFSGFRPWTPEIQQRHSERQDDKQRQQGADPACLASPGGRRPSRYPPAATALSTGQSG